MSIGIEFWIFFNLFFLLMLALDLVFFHNKSHTISIKEAINQAFGWIAPSLIFNLSITIGEGGSKCFSFHEN